jgi:hypothetical protein
MGAYPKRYDDILGETFEANAPYHNNGYKIIPSKFVNSITGVYTIKLFTLVTKTV